MGLDHAHYESISILEMTLSDDGDLLTYPCPCGDTFELEVRAFRLGKDVAQCPTCSLTIKVLLEGMSREFALNELRPKSLSASA
jgi:diphthamide biosynthesis protein 3